jgi:hypothetical protein
MVGAAVVLIAAAVTAGVVAMSGGKEASSAALQTPVNTAKVEKGRLSAVVSLSGILTYRSPYSLINRARGTYTELPAAGDKADCGDVLYRVDEHPVLLLCGAVPAYRDLHAGDKGRDVWQLNRNLRRLGYHAGAGAVFTPKTDCALTRLQHHEGSEATGELGVGDAVFLPEAVRIAKVTGELGGSARPGAQVAQATSDTLGVQVDLDPSQQGEVKQGDRARITLPGLKVVNGRVARLGRIAVSAGKDAGAATIPAWVRLADPAKARGLDRAPVQVDIRTGGVKSALSVPVTALVGRSGGGFAVEVVRAGGQRELVAVKLGLFDGTDGRVQVAGDLAEGDDVVVPSL